MNARWKGFVALVAAQAIFLVAWAGYHEIVRGQVPAILLKGRPVDPRDLLRGDYMILSYDISDVPLGGASASVNGTDVWLLLERRERHFVVARASVTPLTPGAGQVLVRGDLAFQPAGGAPARVNYGIERFFVPEGKGTPRFTTLEVEVAVSPAHRLYIRRVLLDGKAYPERTRPAD